MKFVEPLLLTALIPVLILLPLFYIMAEKRKKALLDTLLGSRENRSDLSPAGRMVKFTFFMLAVIMLIIAASSPYYRTEKIEETVQSRDVLILFDVSRSMLAKDVPPSRMAQAKFLLNEVISAFPGDRFGLIPFAGRAFLSCPLTADHRAVLTAVDDLDTYSVPLGGTDLNDAVKVAVRAFEGSSGSHRAVLLISDGGEADENAASSAEKLAEMNIPVIAVGLGSPDTAAPIPGENGGFMRQKNGEIAGSRLNEQLLKQISGETGGIYVASTVGDTGFAEVKKFLSGIVPEAGQTGAMREIPDTLTIYFVLAALIFMLISALWRERKISRALLIFAVVMPLFTVSAAEENASPEEVYNRAREMQLQNQPEAAGLYEKLIADPATPGYLLCRAMENRAVQIHSEARSVLAKCRTTLQTGNAGEAEKLLKDAASFLDRSEELYTGAMNFIDRKRNDDGLAGNFQQLWLDRRELEKLQKELEELKKQQQQQQDKQQQQQQQQQDKKEQQQQQQDKDKQDKSDKTTENGDSGEDKSDKTTENGDSGEDKSDKTTENGDSGEEKTDKKPENGDSGEDKSDKTTENGDSGEDKPDQPPISAASAAPESAAEKEEKSSAAKKIELLSDEADKLREAIRLHRQNMRRPPVQKNW